MLLSTDYKDVSYDDMTCVLMLERCLVLCSFLVELDSSGVNRSTDSDDSERTNMSGTGSDSDEHSVPFAAESKSLQVFALI